MPVATQESVEMADLMIRSGERLQWIRMEDPNIEEEEEEVEEEEEDQPTEEEPVPVITLPAAE